tara:strand:+ start:11516 stop:12241 length:726 start_codon:yes stop_codon:yes gene_type:complete
MGNVAEEKKATAEWEASPAGKAAKASGVVEDIYGGEPMEDVPGIDPDEYAKIEQSLIDNAEFAYQQGINTISRQYAMMGMTGSGANIAANNALMAEIADQLLREQSALATANQQQIEIDLAERAEAANKELSNAIALMTSGAQVDQIGINNQINLLTAIDTTLGGYASQFWSMTEQTPTPQEASAYAWILAEFQKTGDVELANLRMSELLAGKLPQEFIEDGPYADAYKFATEGGLGMTGY